MFSVIIPTLNEEKIILEQINDVKRVIDAEIIIVDGGSTDSTKEICEKEHMKTLSSPKGRGIQCNSGARAASNEFLLFLHADSRLPENANKTLTDFFSNPSNLIGAFTIQFKPSHIILDLITVASRIDTPITSFGDQCIFMRRELYDEIGGFPDWPLFEDMKMFQEARKLTKVHKIKGPSDLVLSSVLQKRSAKTARFKHVANPTILSGGSPRRTS
jgi:rSAM/selenodomain-associated transferase 2